MSASEQNILIIDDDPDLLTLLAQMFRARFEVQTATASSVDEAELLLKQRRFNLIVTDLHMPVRGGRELIRFLAREDVHVPLFMFTASAVSQEEVDAYRYPCTLIHKPDCDRLMAAVGEFCLKREPPKTVSADADRVGSIRR